MNESTHEIPEDMLHMRNLRENLDGERAVDYLQTLGVTGELAAMCRFGFKAPDQITIPLSSPDGEIVGCCYVKIDSEDIQIRGATRSDAA